MKKIQDLLRIVAFGLVLCLAVCPLSAQKNKKSAEKNSAKRNTMTLTSNTDSLQFVIDSLQNALREMEVRCDQQQQELQRLRAGAGSPEQDCDMSYVMNYGNALLFRRYSARVEDIANLLISVPDSLKQKDRDQMLDQARRMIEASNVSQDIRKRVKELLEETPRYEQFSEDIREVLRNVPAEAQYEYNLTQHAIDLIDAMPKTVTDSDDRYAIVRELLVAYKSSNEEIKSVLQSIQNDPDNSINISDRWPAFVNKIKATQYYKRYYGKPWTIPYLNGIIDQALARLQNAQKHVDLRELINSL